MKKTLERIIVVFKNEQCRDTGNIGNTAQNEYKQNKQNDNTEN